MSLGWGLLVAWLLVGNIITFLLFGWDKARARRDGRRVSEATLVLWSGLTGTVGGWLGMWAFRHKTAKRSFQAKMLAASAIDMAVVLLAIWLT